MAQTIPKPGGQLGESERTLPKHPSRLRFLIPIGVLVAGVGAATWYFLSRPDTNTLKFSGRLEGYETDVGAKVAGRVMEVTVREGAQVRKGRLLVKLDDDEVRAQLAGAEARLRAAQDQARNAQLQLSVVENQIAETQYKIRQSQGDASGQVSQAEARVAAAIAQLKQAEADAVEAQAQLKLAQVDRDRYTQLVQQGAVTQREYDQIQTTLDAAQATLESRRAAVVAAQRQVSAAQGELTQSRSTTFNPDINTAQLNRLNVELEQARAALASAQADVKSAVAERDQTRAQLAYLTINSPIDGVVTARSVEPGVVVTSGKTLLTLLDLNTVYMRGFIPEGEIGHVRVGQAASVYLDSAPDRALTARVSAIDSQASFTPENIYFRDDRVQQVFGVRLTIEHPGGFAKPGMPADAQIVLNPEQSP